MGAVPSCAKSRSADSSITELSTPRSRSSRLRRYRNSHRGQPSTNRTRSGRSMNEMPTSRRSFVVSASVDPSRITISHSADPARSWNPVKIASARPDAPGSTTRSSMIAPDARSRSATRIDAVPGASIVARTGTRSRGNALCACSTSTTRRSERPAGSPRATARTGAESPRRRCSRLESTESWLRPSLITTTAATGRFPVRDRSVSRAPASRVRSPSAGGGEAGDGNTESRPLKACHARSCASARFRQTGCARRSRMTSSRDRASPDAPRSSRTPMLPLRSTSTCTTSRSIRSRGHSIAGPSSRNPTSNSDVSRTDMSSVRDAREPRRPR